MSVGRCRKKLPNCCVENYECIYNLLPKINEVVKKPPLYRSNYSSLIKQQNKNQKKFGHRTFGFASESQKPPRDYLKKQSKNPKVMQSVKENKVTGKEGGTSPCTLVEEQKKDKIEVPCRKKKVMSLKERLKSAPNVGDRNAPKPPPCDGNVTIDAKTKAEVKGVHSKQKNFIYNNAKAVIGAKPPPSTKKLFAFTKRGDKLDFEGAGLDMKFCRSEGFGKKPKYLERRRKQVEAARDEYDDKISERMRAGALKKLSPDERENMLACLREKHEKLYQQYNRLPILINSSLMRNRKIRLENILSQLEKDIRLISAHPEIYLAHDVQAATC